SIEDEYGDLLFAVVNLGRHLDVDPEAALTHASNKFRSRFYYIERALAETGSCCEAATLDEMEALWVQAKSNGL
ncbi:MAG: nucleoside triphosphate pyrophosphohydrolase, partial [Pseudomonadota bacterium]